MKSINLVVVGLVCTLLGTEMASAQGVVRGVPCNQQASFDLCVQCIGKRGGGGATGGHAFCSRRWQPQAISNGKNTKR
jgi:hypothetical protein